MQIYGNFEGFPENNTWIVWVGNIMTPDSQSVGGYTRYILEILLQNLVPTGRCLCFLLEIEVTQDGCFQK